MVYLYSSDFRDGISHFFYFKEDEYYIIILRNDILTRCRKVIFEDGKSRNYIQENVGITDIPKFEIPSKPNILNIMYDISSMPIYKDKLIFDNI